MKKSKIIVPALGLLLLSTAASVSGTVAWFTANRTFTTSAGNFAVVKTSTDLICKMSPGVGTAVNNNSTIDNYSDDTITVNSNAKLTDASFDHANKKIIAPDADGVKVGKVTALDTDPANAATLATAITRATGTSDVIYSALTWTMDFEVSYVGTGSNNGLFFDLTGTNFTLSAAAGANDGALGFRLAFVPFTSANAGVNVYQTGEARVLARLRNNASPANVCKYISNPAVGDALSGTNYASPVLIDSADTTAVPDDNTTNTTTASAMTNYLGKFTAVAEKTVHLQFAVVAWFEGTDPNVVNTADLVKTVSAALKFQLVTLTD